MQLSRVVKERELQHVQWKAELETRARQFEEVKVIQTLSNNGLMLQFLICYCAGSSDPAART